MTGNPYDAPKANLEVEPPSLSPHLQVAKFALIATVISLLINVFGILLLLFFGLFPESPESIRWVFLLLLFVAAIPTAIFTSVLAYHCDGWIASITMGGLSLIPCVNILFVSLTAIVGWSFLRREGAFKKRKTP